jgi:hypothetical protein
VVGRLIIVVGQLVVVVGQVVVVVSGDGPQMVVPSLST